jgi:hypothetical protein
MLCGAEAPPLAARKAANSNVKGRLRIFFTFLGEKMEHLNLS